MLDLPEFKKELDAKLLLSDDKIRDLYFIIKFLMAQKDYKAALEYLEALNGFTFDEENLVASAFKLLAACEALGDNGGAREICPAEINRIRALIRMVERNVENTAPHWLYGGECNIYLSNLSIAFAALQNTQMIMDDDGARKCLIGLRDYAFRHFLKGGHLMSTTDCDIRFGELPVCAVPFCMFEAEDRVLVEAMEEEPARFFADAVGVGFKQEREKNKELTLLLAWYFAEKGDLMKGDLIRAKTLYNTAASLCASKGKADFCVILSGIVERVLNRKENKDSGYKIIHTPTGTGDPYFVSDNERIPRIPLEGESVKINAAILPFTGDYAVRLEYSVNDQSACSIDMKRENSENGGAYYSAGIGGSEQGEQVVYRIIAEKDGECAESEHYSYRTAKWFDCDEICGAKYLSNDIANGIVIYFKREKESGIAPALFVKANGNTVLFEFNFEKQVIDTTKLSFDIFGVGRYDIKVVRNGIYLLDKGARRACVGMEGHILSYLYDGESVIMARLNLNSEQEERYFGMGERYSRIEYRGLKVENYVYNQYRSQGMKTYMPCPFYLSSAGYGLYFESNAYSVFDFCCTAPDKASIEGYCSGSRYGLRLFTGTPKEILSAYLSLTGFPELPPVWAFGPWMSSNNWDSQREVLHQLEMTEKHGIPATVLVIEQWSDEATFYLFNDAKYAKKDGAERFCAGDFEFPEWGRWPNPCSMVMKLHEAGMKVLLWQMPFQKYMGGAQHSQHDEDEKVMIEKGYCVKNSDGSPYRIPYGWFASSLVLDFTNPDARCWWLEKRRYLLEDIGIDGFKTDGGECILGDELSFWDGTSGREMHNKYALDYIGAYYDYVKEIKGEGVTFSRAGFAGAQRMPLHWAGDERSTWKAFKASIRAGLSAGLSGIVFWGWDIAGFHGDIPTAELYIRSAQMAAFCPVMQYHAETKGEFNRDRTPWNIADRTGDMQALTIYRDYAVLRMNILPYIYSEAVRCTQSLEPLMRAMFYDFPNDSACLKLDEQYLFGRNMLVAPVTEEGQTKRQVYLPRGRWHGFFDNKTYDGAAYYEVDSPIDRIPVFVKADSIIPLNLNNAFQLFGDVGNHVSRFENLCFDIRLEGKITDSFNFSCTGKVEINAEKSEGLIKAHISAGGRVLLRFLSESRPERISVDGERLQEYKDTIEAGKHGWCYKENSIIIAARSGCYNILL